MSLASEAFDEGQERFDKEDYSRALESFKRSLESFPHFRTVFNIALCEEKLGNIALAVDMYIRYLDWPSKVPNREGVTKKIEELKARLPPESASDPTRESYSEPKPEPELEPIHEHKPKEPILEHESKIHHGREPGRKYIVPGWITMGIGSAGVIAGGVLLGVAWSKNNEMRAIEDKNTQYDSDKHAQLPSKGRFFERAGWITGGVGLAAVGVAVLLLLLPESDSNKSETASLNFSLEPNSMQAQLVLKF
ncbi:MAG: tetratricopeptide repeat protein [Proteobacteria bacterium]|nr:tetratricopeptide repeat protein [Pseudomonadota bacterium]